MSASALRIHFSSILSSKLCLDVNLSVKPYFHRNPTFGLKKNTSGPNLTQLIKAGFQLTKALQTNSALA